jgi:type I restriction enzyme, S subunit
MSVLWSQIPLWAVSSEAQTGPFGSQLHSSEYIENGIPLINPSNILGGKIVPNQAVTVDEYTARRLSRHRLTPGDLLFARRGELGRAAVVTQEAAGWLCGTGSLRVRVRPGTLDAGFTAYVLQSAATRSYFELVAVGTTMDNLNTAIVMGLPVPLPPKQDQLRIAAFLDAQAARIDSLIAKKRHMIELLLARRASVAIYAVSGRIQGELGLESSSLPWLEERPCHWREVLLRLVARLGSGHTPSREHPEWWNDCTIPWITTGEVYRLRSDRVEYIDSTREMISELGLANSSAELHPADTVVLCRTASAGYSGIMKTSMATSQDFATWTCGPLLRPRFLLLCLRAMRQDLLGRLAMGSTHQTIYMPDIRSIRIPLPPVNEQDEIVDAAWSRFGAVDQLVTATERQIGLLQERRRALITAAVTGEMEIPEGVAG